MKKLLLFALTVAILLSCNEKINYNEISEMNSLYPIEIIYFDSKSENELGEFPISRAIYGDLIEIVENQNPKYIVLKFFFDQKRDEDIELYNVISRYDNILTQSTTQIQSDIEIEDYLRGLEDFNVNLKIKDSENVLIPNENLINGFNGVGLVDFIVDDHEYRNFPLFEKVRGKYIPSLATLILMNEMKSDLTVTDDNISFDNIDIAHEDGYMKIDLSKPKGLYHTHSMIDILNNSTITDFENKIIIIFMENEMVRNVKSSYNEMHNKAEIVADSINTILKRMNRR